MSMKAKLQRMRSHLSIEESNDSTIEKREENVNPLMNKWRKLGFKPFTISDETSFQRITIYPFKNGYETLQRDMEKIHRIWQNVDKEHPLSCRHVPLERMLFFDTETTGLSSGAGNSIFLIGYARILQEGIEVTQHVLASPADEVAFLYGFLMDFHEDDYLITYNGKSFDWPHVKSRHAFVRNEVPKLPECGHIDLLHAARRLWKHELPSCRLSIVEKEKLFIDRKNDVPGSLAPILYFDYLQDEDPEHLVGVIEHNDQDVRSLISLYVEICKRLFTIKEPLSAKEHIQIGNWFEQLKWDIEAEEHYMRASRSFEHASYEARYKLGLLYKKQKRYEDAKQLFLQGIRTESLLNVHIYVELSKLLEHVEKDFAQAYEYAQNAFKMMKKSARLTGKDGKLLKDIEKRMDRLKRKMI